MRTKRLVHHGEFFYINNRTLLCVHKLHGVIIQRRLQLTNLSATTATTYYVCLKSTLEHTHIRLPCAFARSNNLLIIIPITIMIVIIMGMIMVIIIIIIIIITTNASVRRCPGLNT